jgi:hypothetical protein
MPDSLEKMKKSLRSLADRKDERLTDDYVELRSEKKALAVTAKNEARHREGMEDQTNDANFYLNQWGLWSRLNQVDSLGYDSSTNFATVKAPEDILIISPDECAAIDRVLAKLDKPTRSMLNLYYEKGISFRKISKTLNLNRNKVDYMFGGYQLFKWLFGCCEASRVNNYCIY